MKDSEELFFAALGNGYRFKILKALLERPMSVGELSKRLELEQSHMSHNLKCLLDCRFVESDVRGRSRIYKLSPETRILVRSVSKYIGYYKKYLRACGVLA